MRARQWRTVTGRRGRTPRKTSENAVRKPFPKRLKPTPVQTMMMALFAPGFPLSRPTPLHSITPLPSLPSEKDVSDPCWIRKTFLTLSFVLRPNDSYFECPNGRWIPNSSVYFLGVDLDKIYSAHVPSRDTKHLKGSDRKKSFSRTLVSGWENISRSLECINQSLLRVALLRTRNFDKLNKQFSNNTKKNRS